MGFGRTATYAAIISQLQERLVDKFIVKLERLGKGGGIGCITGGSSLELVQTTAETLDRISPYLEFKACRALPLSFLRGQLRVDSLQARVREAAMAAAHRSQELQPRQHRTETRSINTRV